MSTVDTTIKSSLVIEEHRTKFLSRHFGPSYLRGENLIFAWGRRLSGGHSIDNWLFFELDNGGFYAAPETGNWLFVRFNENSYEGYMGAEAFGIVVTLWVLRHLANDDRTGRFMNAYHALRSFAVDHRESLEIFRAID